MKRIISSVLLIILLFSISSAFAQDYSSMTDEELKYQYNSMRNELANRVLKEGEKILYYDKEGVLIYITDPPHLNSDNTKIVFPIIIINNKDVPIWILNDGASVNGWTTSGDISQNKIPAGKKAKTSLYFSIKDIDMKSIDDFEDAEIRLTIYNNDTIRVIIDKSEPLTIYSNK